MTLPDDWPGKRDHECGGVNGCTCRECTAHANGLAEGYHRAYSQHWPAVRALRSVEWAVSHRCGRDTDEQSGLCPWCWNTEQEGHAADCTRQEALRRAGYDV
jgi:hypothetical protein